MWALLLLTLTLWIPGRGEENTTGTALEDKPVIARGKLLVSVEGKPGRVMTVSCLLDWKGGLVSSIDLNDHFASVEYPSFISDAVSERVWRNKLRKTLTFD